VFSCSGLSAAPVRNPAFLASAASPSRVGFFLHARQLLPRFSLFCVTGSLCHMPLVCAILYARACWTDRAASSSVFFLLVEFLFLKKHNINADTHTRTITHSYEHTHTHSVPMSTSERLSQLDFKIHKVGHQERLAVDGDVVSH
jgi:hypothetical protein